MVLGRRVGGHARVYGREPGGATADSRSGSSPTRVHPKADPASPCARHASAFPTEPPIAASVTIRILKPSDDLVACAGLLSRVLAKTEPARLMMGLPADEMHAVRLAGLTMAPGLELHAAEYSLTPVGLARLRTEPGKSAHAPGWYREPRVLAFDLLAVEPAMRGMGVGRSLLDALEARARTLHGAELACDLPETATDSIEALARRGYRPVDRIQVNDSARLVLSRTLDPAATVAA